MGSRPIITVFGSSQPRRGDELYEASLEMGALLGRAGFRIETVCSSSVPFGLALPKWDGSILVRSLERLSVECARVWKTLFAYQFIVTARGMAAGKQT